jgi:hypothetical protein
MRNEDGAEFTCCEDSFSGSGCWGLGETFCMSCFRVASEGLEGGERGLGGFRCRFCSSTCQIEQNHK